MCGPESLSFPLCILVCCLFLHMLPYRVTAAPELKGVHAAILEAFAASQRPGLGPKIYVYPPFLDHPWAHVDCNRTLMSGYSSPKNYHWESLVTPQLKLLPNYHSDPDMADFLVFPVHLSCMEIALMQEKKYHHMEARVKVLAQYVKPYLLHIRSQPYFKKRNGADHVTMFAGDRGVCGSRELRKLLGDAIALTTYGLDDDPTRIVNMIWPWSVGCYVPERTIIVPLNKAELSNYHIHQPPVAPASHAERPYLAYFAGNIDNQLVKGAGLRQLLKLMMEDKENVDGGLLVRHVNPPADQRLREMNSSLFCLCPPGAGQSSPRPHDCWAAGSVPVFLADGTDQPFERYLDYRSMSVKVQQANTVYIVRLLQHSVRSTGGAAALAMRQRHGREMLQYLLWSGDPRRNAAAMVVLELACRFFWKPGHAGMPALCNSGYKPTAYDAWL